MMTTQLRQLGDPATHFWLTRSVARVMGVNLSEAMAEGVLTPVDYAGMVNQCRKCDRVAQCHDWLSQKRQRPSPAPAHCCNADLLSRLSKQETA